LSGCFLSGSFAAETNTGGKAASGYALVFNGTNSYVSVTNESLFRFTNSFTLEVWIKVKSFASDWQAILTKGDTSWRLHRNDGDDIVAFGTSGPSDTDLPGVKKVTDGQWHHVAAVFDDVKKTKFLYVDGALDASTAFTGTLDQNDSPFLVGENSEQTGRVFDGQMDEVRIWKVARTADEISQNMKRPLKGTEPGLVLYFRFDEGSGAVTANAAPAPLKGQLIGSPKWVPSTAPVR
jgi:Concanavalin A-like lectin/glucanases superfamily